MTQLMCASFVLKTKHAGSACLCCLQYSLISYASLVAVLQVNMGLL